jgi:hypothetical protein
MKRLLLALALLYCGHAWAQDDTTDNIDYSKFGDAEGVKRFATPRVLNQSPLRIISIGYEYQFAFDMPSVPRYDSMGIPGNYRVNRVSGLRFQANIPIISHTKIIWQMGASYWHSGWNFDNTRSNPFVAKLNEKGMHTAGINTFIFKPLNEKNFIVAQVSADVNGVFDRIGDVNSKAITYGGAILFGWKTSDKNAFALGLSRTYRAGQPIIVPTVLWNKTFNDRWGMELLLPARAHLRYNISPSNLLQLGYELEGNQFWMQTTSPNGQVFIQRGELKPRIMWDKKLWGFFWLNLQAGLRYNWRFDVMNEYNSKKKSERFFSSALRNPFYIGINISFVSP